MLLGLAAAVLILVALGARLEVANVDVPCPAGTQVRSLGLQDGLWGCVGGGLPQPGAPGAVYGKSQHEVGLYLTRIRWRVFDLDLDARNGLWLGMGVDAP